MKIVYRRWELHDVEQIRGILQDTWLDSYSKFIPQEDLFAYLNEHYSLEALTKFFDESQTVGFIAEVDDTVGGYEKTYYDTNEHRLYVQQLYILPQYQGHGIGKQLMAFAAERAKNFNLNCVWLGVMVENTSALLWYQNMGYKIVEKTPFTMGKTSVEHFIGYIPVDDIFRIGAHKPE